NRITVADQSRGALDDRHAGDVELPAQRCAVREDAAGLQHQSAQACERRCPAGVGLAGDENVAFPNPLQLRDIIYDACTPGDLARAGGKPDQFSRCRSKRCRFVIRDIAAAKEFWRLLLERSRPFLTANADARCGFANASVPLSNSAISLRTRKNTSSGWPSRLRR